MMIQNINLLKFILDTANSEGSLKNVRYVGRGHSTTFIYEKVSRFVDFLLECFPLMYCAGRSGILPVATFTLYEKAFGAY